MVSKEQFNEVFSATSRKGILNQFYYEHIELQKALARENKAIDILNNIYMLDNVTITNNATKKIDRAINILEGSDKE